MEMTTKMSMKSLTGGSSTLMIRGGTRAVATMREKTSLGGGIETIVGTETTAEIGTEEGVGHHGGETDPHVKADRREGTKAEEEIEMNAPQGERIETGGDRARDPARAGIMGIREGPASTLQNLGRGKTH